MSAGLVLAGCSSPGTIGPVVGNPPPVIVAAAVASIDAAVAVGELDSDRDGHLDRCDHCPSEPEVYNGILDEDGCPDNSGISHAVMTHPTHEYGRPFGIIGGTTTMQRDDDDLDALVQRTGLEALACVVHVAAGAKSARVRRTAKNVATKTCAALASRIPYPVTTVALVTPAAKLLGMYEWREVDQVVIVTRAQGVEVWRWTGNDFERGAPLATLPQIEPIAGCE